MTNDSPRLSGRMMVSDSPGVHTRTITVDGIRREFSYYVPEKSAGKKLPVVFYLHGHGDSMRHILGQGVVASASSKWMDVADREGFLVFYPLGYKAPGWRSKTGWNDCRKDAEGNPEVDDIAFIKQLINFAVDDLNGDPRRVYVTGMSNGGHMAMRVAMEMPSKVAAVAPVVALLTRDTKCSPPSEPVPILLMYGTKDPIAPYQGGPMASGRGQVMSANETVQTWVKWNKLEHVAEKDSAVPDRDKSDNSTIRVRTREASPSGDAVVAYEVEGGGHTEPSETAKMGRFFKSIQGDQNNDIEMADTIWQFFKTRSR